MQGYSEIAREIPLSVLSPTLHCFFFYYLYVLKDIYKPTYVGVYYARPNVYRDYSQFVCEQHNPRVSKWKFIIIMTIDIDDKNINNNDDNNNNSNTNNTNKYNNSDYNRNNSNNNNKIQE